MNAPIQIAKARNIVMIAALLSLGASALAGGTGPTTIGQVAPVQPLAPQTAAPQAPLQGQVAPVPGDRPAPPTPGRKGPRRGPGPRPLAPSQAPAGQMTLCRADTDGANASMPHAHGNSMNSPVPGQPVPGGPRAGGPKAAAAPHTRPTPAQTAAQPTLPTPGGTTAAPTPPAPKIGANMMNKGGPNGKGMGKGIACPPMPKAIGQAAPNVAALQQAAPAARDLRRLDALAAQTTDARVRGYLNDARTYLQSANRAKQKAGRDLLHAAEALTGGDQTPRR
ncbi:hypothetical protein [Deinococcus alpinitundrae]|uniref:hypothetical protein n=1 Tax=Deinococcus alpinitundrae TaxID=468913 RepID=UPI00137A26E5|nr:hypothetical protein [Deinococcus alpinitundrae]